MELTVNYIDKKHNSVTETVNSFPSVSVFWKSIASFIRKAAVPSRITAVSENNGKAAISIKKRDGNSASLFAEVADETYGLTSSPFSERYLVNGKKAYVLLPVPNEDGITQFTAAYGNSDEILSGKGKHVKAPYPIAEYWVRYYEKIAKGYKDRSRYVSLTNKSKSDDETGTSLFNTLLDETIKNLPVNRLSKNARKIEKIALSDAQVEKAWKILRQLKRAKRLKTFRALYQGLLSLLPKTNSSFLPESLEQYNIDNKDRLFKNIAESLSDLENIVACKSSFADRGVSISIADDNTKNRIIAMLPDDIASRVETVYAVHDAAKEANFKDYCDRRKITETKELWHGSKNENWLSIIKNGLLLHPNAAITGKMFGDGIYFAPEAKKSYNYTSCQGTYWARGSSKFGIMGLFTTAYGKPCHDTSKFRSYSSRNQQKALVRGGFGCLHALASQTSLLHDEIVYYSQSAVLLSYLVKIAS